MSLYNILFNLNIFNNIVKPSVIFNENSYINYILIIFILISLIFTFNKKSTTVHKVLGLLLSSIFVVFLWILQTQFLFIYIVYILAFISAVLMLFLSVVLMLPISTNVLQNKSKILKNTSIILLFIDNNFNVLIKFALISLFVWFIILYYFSTYFSMFKITMLSFNNMKLLLSTLIMSIIKLLSSIIDNILQYKHNFISIIVNIDVFYLTLKYYIIYIKNIILMYCKIFTELFLQFVLYSSFTVLVVSPLLLKQTWFSSNVNDLSFDISVGIGQIKLLLYGDFSLFLIFSTVVLLIALFGAAIMTRSSK
jgi:NADH:ubiquinone oxidoreductase subunit 6 (subunit J)